MKKVTLLFAVTIVFLVFGKLEPVRVNSKENFKIKNGYVYFMNKKIKTLDASTFKELNDYYVADKNGIYFYDSSTAKIMEPVVKTAGEILDEEEYRIYEEYLFYKGSFYMSGRLIEESQGNKFDFDKKTLKIIGIQPVVGEIPCEGKEWTGSCSVIHRDLIFSDKNGVYITIEHMDIWMFKGIDAETFVKIKDGEYKDKNGSYTMEELWERASKISIK
jgi:hypothetical protein